VAPWTAAIPISTSIVLCPPPVLFTRFQPHFRLELFLERIQTPVFGIVWLDKVRKMFLFDHGHALMVILLLVSQLQPYNTKTHNNGGS
jgi:hypothetical protein